MKLNQVMPALLNGKKIRRQSWINGLYYVKKDDLVLVHDTKGYISTMGFDINEILAEDWIIEGDPQENIFKNEKDFEAAYDSALLFINTCKYTVEQNLRDYGDIEISGSEYPLWVFQINGYEGLMETRRIRLRNNEFDMECVSLNDNSVYGFSWEELFNDFNIINIIMKKVFERTK